MTLKRVQVLDRERRVYRGMESVDEADIDPEIHLEGECDLPPNQYRWDGSTYLPLPPEQRAAVARPTLDQALVFDMLARREAGAHLPDVTLDWLDDMVLSFDLRGYIAAPLVSDYIDSRPGLREKLNGQKGAL